jgi:hypothetical protein
MRWLRGDDGRGWNLVGRFANQVAVGRDLPGGNGGLRLGAAFEQAARDQKAIRALAFDHGNPRSTRPTPAQTR